MNLPLKNSPDSACYIPAIDELRMPPIENFNSSEAYYMTMLHELGHATGHKNRLNRELVGDKYSDSYAKEELVAEFNAVLLGNELGLVAEDDIDNNKAYIQAWIKQLKNDPKYLFDALQSSIKAKNYILDKMEIPQIERYVNGINKELVEDEELEI
ncbi:MAG: zincin-like metallopeptidase domain-containing protein [Erysipelotrichaceae bacterium]